mmetsp:Transcript_4223/g.8823  ORF Transcript_4223/g.8823 Transcript_4223/m.8823 type:complete len:202 (+) Transcript_4223:75-680(+)
MRGAVVCWLIGCDRPKSSRPGEWRPNLRRPKQYRHCCRTDEHRPQSRGAVPKCLDASRRSSERTGRDGNCVGRWPCGCGAWRTIFGPTTSGVVVGRGRHYCIRKRPWSPPWAWAPQRQRPRARTVVPWGVPSSRRCCCCCCYCVPMARRFQWNPYFLHASTVPSWPPWPCSSCWVRARRGPPCRECPFRTAASTFPFPSKT